MVDRLCNYCVAGLSIFALSVAVSMTGLSHTAAAGVQKGVQQVLITNKSIPVTLDSSGNAVQDVPNAPTQPVQFEADVQIPKSGSPTSDTGGVSVNKDAFTVPSGKRLVIEFVSADITGFFSATERAIVDYTVGGPGNPGPRFFVPVDPQGAVGSADQGQGFHYVGDEVTRVYADAGRTVSVEVEHDFLLGPVTAKISFSGYLVSAA